MENLTKTLLINKISPKGVIHIGAHLAEEAGFYDKLDIGNVLWIEGNPLIFEELVNKINKYPRQKAVLALLSDKSEPTEFHITNNAGHSSSLLKLDYSKTKNVWNGLAINKTLKLNTKRLDEIITEQEVKEKYNILSIDVQGAELMVLKGIGNYLSNFEAIITEVNFIRLYKNSAVLLDIEIFLNKAGFSRTYLSIADSQGEATYIKSLKLNMFAKKNNLFIVLIIQFLAKLHIFKMLKKSNSAWLKYIYKRMFQ